VISPVGPSLTNCRPHASNETSFQWNDAAIMEVYSVTNANVYQITELRGNSRLDGKNSIMHYDRPSEMVASPFFCPDRVDDLDEQAIQLLKELYPSPRDFEAVDQWCSQMPGWKETSTEQKLLTKDFGLKWTDGEEIGALNYVDIAENGNYEASAYVTYPSYPKVLTFTMGALGVTTHIINLRASFLLLKAPDYGIQSGCENSRIIRGSRETRAQGEEFEKRINFNKPFRSPPKVLNFIYQFCVEKGNWIRMKVFTKDVSTIGFTICFHSWAGKFPTQS
jgi:hypothetical protein